MGNGKICEDFTMKNTDKAPLNQPLSGLNETQKPADDNLQKPLATPASEPVPPAPNPPQPNTPDANPAQTKPDSATKPGRSSSGGNKAGKQAASVVASTKSMQMMRVSHDFSETLNRMGGLIKKNTRLAAPPLQIVLLLIDVSDVLMKEIHDAWFLLLPPESCILLHEKLKSAEKMQESLGQIAVVGKAISKFGLDHEAVGKLKRHAAALKAYFGKDYLPGDVLVMLWKRGGILIAEALSRPQGQS
jgi:hypothetical protein